MDIDNKKDSFSQNNDECIISIIVCSCSQERRSAFSINVQKTIGVPNEIIIIDNTNGEYSIFEAYNIGLSKAKGTIVCFAHEDIYFETNDWGKLLISHFEDVTIGLIGVIGNYYIPQFPIGFWSTRMSSNHIIDERDGKRYYYNNRLTDSTSSIEDAALVDGVFMCISKKVADSIHFDTTLFSGFHCYDSELCMLVHNLGLRVTIAFDILLVHLSGGTKNKQWVENTYKWYKKWKTRLPIDKHGFSQKEIDLQNYYSAWEMVERIVITKPKIRIPLELWVQYIKINLPTTKVKITYLINLLKLNIYMLIKEANFK